MPPRAQIKLWGGLSSSHLAFSLYTIEGRARILPPLGVSTTAEKLASVICSAGRGAGAGVLAMAGPVPVSALVAAAAVDEARCAHQMGEHRGWRCSSRKVSRLGVRVWDRVRCTKNAEVGDTARRFHRGDNIAWYCREWMGQQQRRARERVAVVLETSGRRVGIILLRICHPGQGWVAYVGLEYT